MSTISDPTGFTTNTLTLLSFTITLAAVGGGYTSFCATSHRYEAVVALLDHWDNYMERLTPEEKEIFERAQPGELDRISTILKRLRTATASLTLELDNHRWWRYFPMSDVCGEFRDWDNSVQQATRDFYTTTEKLRSMHRPSAMLAQTQVAVTGTQGMPRVDRNRAIRWLNTVRAHLPDIRLRGIVDGLNAVMVSQC